MYDFGRCIQSAGRLWAGFIEARIDPPDEKYSLNFVSVQSANGHSFDFGKTYSAGQSNTNYLFGFPPGITNVDFTIGLTKKLFIEGSAQPTIR